MVAIYNANLVMDWKKKKKARLYYIISGWQAEGLPLYVNRICPSTKKLFVCTGRNSSHFNQRVSDGGTDRDMEGMKGGAMLEGESVCVCVRGTRCVFPVPLHVPSDGKLFFFVK